MLILSHRDMGLTNSSKFSPFFQTGDVKFKVKNEFSLQHPLAFCQSKKIEIYNAESYSPTSCRV